MQRFPSRRRRMQSTPLSSGLIALMLAGFGSMQPNLAAAATTTVCAASTFSAGFSDSAAVVNGSLFAWGRNFEGQLGLGYRLDLAGSPTAVATSTGLTNVVGVWAGFQTTFATDPSGHVWGWGGFNAFGERGNNGNNIPEPVVGPTNVVSIGPGDAATIAVTKDGVLWGWGSPANLGLPGFFPVNPMVLPGPANVVKVAAGDPFSLALSADGTLYGTGGNQKGQLGLGSGVNIAHSFEAIPVSGVVDFATSDSVGTEFTLAVDGSGNVFGFGSNFYGQMGFPAANTFQFTPVKVPGIGSVVQVAAGNGHSLALRSDGTVWSWGENENGQLGNGTQLSSSTPAPIQFPGGVKIVHVAAGGAHSIALDANGHLWAWGYNGDGEIGNGFIIGAPVLTPVQLNLGPVASPCAPPAPKTYLPSVNGYAFANPGNPKTPSYARMAAFYPSSSWEMYYPIVGGHTYWGDKFYNEAFVPVYVGAPGFAGGLCYGMAASDQFLYNEFPNKSAVLLYPAQPLGLDAPFPGDLGASPSPSDATIQDFIDRYHSRQLAASGVLASIDSWKSVEGNGGNRGALDTIAAVVAAGKTEWIGLGPSQAALTQEGQNRFLFLFNESHAVLAYGVDKVKMQVRVYDPNDPGDDHAYLQVVDSTMNPGGGIELVHHGDQPSPDISYGSGTATGQDLGQPGEWTMVPLPEKAFSDAGIVSGQDNRHWALDAVPEIVVAAAGGIPLPYVGIPIYRILDVRKPDQTSMQYLPSNTSLSGTVTAAGPGSSSTLMANMHTAQATQTDATAVGTTHQVAISPSADGLTLSNASAAEQYTIQLSADSLASAYGRQATVSGVSLIPGGTLSMSADSTFSSLFVGPTGMNAEQVGLVLEQRGQGAGSVGVTLTVPGDGSSGTVLVGDWTALSTSLVFEVITDAQGRVTGILLQDNPAQRQQLSAALLQKIQSLVASIADDGIRNSLQSKLDNATRQAGRTPGAASNILDAMRNEIAAQNGKAIDPSLATTLDSTLRDEIGLLRAPLA